MPNLAVDVNSWARSACFPQGSFYPLSDGPSIRHRRITNPDFRPCSSCCSHSQARFCICTRRLVSIFYPLSDGPSIRHRRITNPDFRPCSSCCSHSQARFCICTRRLVSIQPERTFGRLRYSLGGDRPSQTARLALELLLSQSGTLLHLHSPAGFHPA